MIADVMIRPFFAKIFIFSPSMDLLADFAHA
jgi:hypothetical protein